MVKKIKILFSLCLFVGFAQAQNDIVFGLNGTPFSTNDLVFQNRSKLEEELKLAEKAFEISPKDLNTIIWYGRRLAYLGRFNEAIQIFSKGLEVFPKNPELLRHRGHRYLTTRNLELARKDLSLAAKKSKKLPILIESDGRPNEQNKNLGNLQRNIYYHWALTEYYAGNFPTSILLWKKCLTYCEYVEMKVSVWDWLFLSYLKSNNSKRAEEVLETLPTLSSLMENDNYYRRLLMYKNLLKDKNKKIIEPKKSDSINIAYGIACLAESKNEPLKAVQILKDILETKQWNSFSYLAAEADLLRILGK